MYVNKCFKLDASSENGFPLFDAVTKDLTATYEIIQLVAGMVLRSARRFYFIYLKKLWYDDKNELFTKFDLEEDNTHREVCCHLILILLN